MTNQKAMKSDARIKKQINEDPTHAILVLMKQMAKFLEDADDMVDSMNHFSDQVSDQQDQVKTIIKMLIEHNDSQRKALAKNGIEFVSPIPKDVITFLQKIDISNAEKESKGQSRH